VTVRWGFLGAGFVATKALAPAVHAAPGALLHAAAARDPARAKALGPSVVHGSYEALLADPDVDAVYISLTNEAHLPWVLASLRAGKHVLCEKPLGLTADEVREMAAAAGDRLLVEASWYRWHPRVRLAQQRLRDVGEVQHVSAGFTFGGVPNGNYRLEPGRGGGALYDVGHYAVSAVLWAVGQGPPSDVAARSLLGPTGVDLVTEAVLDWPSGASAEVRAGIDEGEGQWLVVSGTAGELELRDAPFTSWVEDDTELWVSDGRGTERLAVPATDAYAVMVEEVSSVVAGGPGWVLPLEESLACAQVLDAIRAAAAASAPTG
jgi:xylose dehydrogenase (NAD/NADP)